MIRYLIGLPVLAFAVALAIGAVTGRLRAKSCCSVADPNLDVRMREHRAPTHAALTTAEPRAPQR